MENLAALLMLILIFSIGAIVINFKKILKALWTIIIKFWNFIKLDIAPVKQWHPVSLFVGLIGVIQFTSGLMELHGLNIIWGAIITNGFIRMGLVGQGYEDISPMYAASIRSRKKAFKLTKSSNYKGAEETI